jgi:hypothetical protein
MKKNHWLSVCFTVLLSIGLGANAAVTLHPLFTQGMVLQRDAAVPIWGRAAPGEKVTVEFAGKSRTAVADASGKWLLQLSRMRASAEPRTLAITGSTDGTRIEITNVLVVAQGGPLKAFAVAGADKIFHWADAEIDGKTVVVSAKDVSQPVAVRYAWANDPEGCNLYNQAGLPAVPFRTDDWQAKTFTAR